MRFARVRRRWCSPSHSVGGRIVVIGVAERSQVLHRIAVEETHSDVTFSAATGVAPLPSARVGLSWCRGLWVVDIDLADEVGERSVWTADVIDLTVILTDR